ERRRDRLARDRSRVREPAPPLGRCPCGLVCEEPPHVRDVLLVQRGAEMELAAHPLDRGGGRLLSPGEVAGWLRQDDEEHDEHERGHQPKGEQRLREPNQEEAPVAQRPSAPNSRLSVSEATQPAIFGFSWRRRSE